jgi:HTH-type transcriptional regulator/antitoxin HigA
MLNIFGEGGKMAAVAERLYCDLLKEYEPQVIKTEEENERWLRVLSEILSRGEESLSPDERRFVELVSTLISNFERSAYRIGHASPADILRELMRARGMTPRDMAPVFGSKGITSEVLRGKRGISKRSAKALAQMFCVSVDLFI